MNEFKVGLLTIATLISVAVMSIKITANQSGFGDYVPYRTVLQDATGIFPKTPIKVAGINAGRITKISLQGTTALIDFEVLEKVVVTSGSKIAIKTVGVLGDKYIELQVNPNSTELMEPNTLMETKVAVGIDSLAAEVGEVVADVKAIVGDLKLNLATPDKDGKTAINQIVGDIKEFSRNANIMVRSLKRVTADNEGKLVAIIDNIEKFTRQLKDHMNADREDSLMGDLKHVVANADQITRDLQSIVSDVRNGKGTIGQLLSEDEIADEVKETLASVKKIVQKVDAVKTEIEVYSGVNSRNGWETDANVWIYPSPERFFIFGVSSSEKGVAKEKTTITITNGAKSVEDESVTDKNTYTFNAMMGRKIHNLYVRGGLIESTAGFGLDYDLDRVGMTLTMEVFDFNFDRGTNVRIAAKQHFWNILYLRAMAESLFQSKRNYTLSVGLRLLDEDLKGIMGLFF